MVGGNRGVRGGSGPMSRIWTSLGPIWRRGSLCQTSESVILGLGFFRRLPVVHPAGGRPFPLRYGPVSPPCGDSCA